MKRFGIAICLVMASIGTTWATDQSPAPPDDTFTCPEGTVQIEDKVCRKLADVDCPDGWTEGSEVCECESGMTADDGSCIVDNPEDVEPGDPGNPTNCPYGHHIGPNGWCIVDCPPGTVTNPSGFCIEDTECPCGWLINDLCIGDAGGPHSHDTIDPVTCEKQTNFASPEWWNDVMCEWVPSMCEREDVFVGPLVVINYSSVDVYDGNDGTWKYHLPKNWGDCYRGEVPVNGKCVNVSDVDTRIPHKARAVYIWNPIE